MKLHLFLTAIFSVTFCIQASAKERFTYEQMQTVLNDAYAQDVMSDMTELKTVQDIKDVYGFFLPKNQRPTFFKNLKKMPTIERQGNILSIQMPVGAPIQLEIVDLLKQEFRINGRLYVHDLKGDMLVQRDRMRYQFRHRKTAAADLFSPMNLLFPQAEAQGWEEAALAACIAGGCEMVLGFAEREAIFLFARSAVIRGISAEVTKAAEKEAIMAIDKGFEVTAQYIVRLSKEAPKVVEVAKAGTEAVAKVAHPAWKAATWLKATAGAVFLTGLGAYTNSAIATVNKIGMLTALECIFHRHYPDSTCPDVTAKVNVSDKSDVSSPNGVDPSFCAHNKVNETAVAVPQKDGSKLILLNRNAIDGVNIGLNISSVRYVVDPNNQVATNSIRTYDYDPSGLNVIRIHRPDIKESSIDANLLLTKKSDKLTDENEIDKDMQKQITRRERILSSLEEGRPDIVVVDGDLLTKIQSDPIAAEAHHLTTEIEWMKQAQKTVNPIVQLCDLKGKKAAEIKSKIDSPDTTTTK